MPETSLSPAPGGLEVNDLLASLETSIHQHHPLRFPRKRTVELVIGNDREIGRDTHSQEKRVGITPDQVRQLFVFLREVGLTLNVLVVQGAGQRAGFSDAAFVNAGAEILAPEEFLYHDAPPDVVHALKEPSRYESTIPGPFCRIGALHMGDFHASSGLAGLLEKKNVAIFDGSHTGAPGAFRIPIRGGMSVFAGEIAAEWVRDHLGHRRTAERVVVVGAGNAGKSAVRKLVEMQSVSEAHLFDSTQDSARLAGIRTELAGMPKVVVAGIEGIDHPNLVHALKEAAAVIFAVARPGEAAPKVVHVNTLKSLLADNAIVVDISIDEGGAILDPSIRRSWTHAEIIPHLTRVIGSHSNRVYRALPNMPRAYPKQASAAHGKVILPYLATLLFLAAREDGAEGVIRFLERHPIDSHSPDPRKVEPARVLDALVQDLRNGMAFYPRGGKLVVADTVADRARIFDFLHRQKIPFSFAVPAAPILDASDKEKEMTAVSIFPDPIRDCLTYVIDKGLRCTVVSHPGIDGTRTENAKDALGVGAEKILKCLIFRADDHFVAAVCTGRKHVSEEILRDLTGAREVKLATADEVLKVTEHTKGGVPVVQVFAMNQLAAVYVDEEVMSLDAVYGSAGTEFAGMRIMPSALKALGGRVVRITPEDSRLRRHEKRVRQLLQDIKDAIEEDQDESAHRAVNELREILEEPPSSRE